MFENPDQAERCVAWRAEQVPSASCLDATPERDTRRTETTRLVRTCTVTSPQEVLGAKAYARLREVDVTIDLVNVLRAAEFIDDIVDECIALKLKALWIQEGIVNEPAGERARAAGIMVVMDRCIYRDYRKECV